jgi:hypothetical protein
VTRYARFSTFLIALSILTACVPVNPQPRADSDCIKQVLSPAGIKSLHISADSTKLLILHGKKPSGESTFTLFNLQN